MTVETLAPSLRSRLRGAVHGLLIGDALGVPYEFSDAAELPPLHLLEMEPPPGFRRAHPGVLPGTWSDDGAQALHLLRVLLAGEEHLEARLAQGLRAWARTGDLTPDARIFDIGIQTQLALARLDRGAPATRSGPAEERDNGNGSLMRVLPAALLPAPGDTRLIERARRQSLPTHGHARALLACAFSTLIGARLLSGMGFVQALEAAQEVLVRTTPPAEQAELQVLLDGRHLEPQGTGYVVDCFWSAVAAMLRTQSFEDCVRCAIAFGNDTDTTACVAGGWAGLLYGEDAIPARWRAQLRGRALVEPLLERLVATWNRPQDDLR